MNNATKSGSGYWIPAGLFALLLVQSTAYAASVRWTMNIDPFVAIGGDTVLLSGSFDYDADLNAFTNVDINISGITVNNPGDIFKPSTNLNGKYNLLNFGSERGVLLVKDLDNNGISLDDGVVSLSFNTSPSLRTTTGSTDISASGFGYCSNIFPAGNCGFFSLGGSPGIATSSVPGSSSVPLPAAVWLFGSGLIGLIGIARRKKAA